MNGRGVCEDVGSRMKHVADENGRWEGMKGNGVNLLGNGRVNCDEETKK
jgi:hypothetical protein